MGEPGSESPASRFEAQQRRRATAQALYRTGAGLATGTPEAVQRPTAVPPPVPAPAPAPDPASVPVPAVAVQPSLPATPDPGEVVALRLRVVEGVSAGTSFALVPGEHVVGRDAACDLVVPAPRVSRRHARLTVRPGEATIEDLGSSNGTNLNGQPLRGIQPLRTGDRLSLGDESVEVDLASIGDDTTVTPRS
jgi:hypothetical protein